MSYILLGLTSLISSAAFLMLFHTFPKRASVFPILITVACFVLPGAVALLKGIRRGEMRRFAEIKGGLIDKYVAEMKTKKFAGIVGLFILTVLYVVGTATVGFFPTSVLYFLIVLLGVYRMPIKGTLIYTVCSIAFLYVFFVVIFKVQV